MEITSGNVSNAKNMPVRLESSNGLLPSTPEDSQTGLLCDNQELQVVYCY